MIDFLSFLSVFFKLNVKKSPFLNSFNLIDITVPVKDHLIGVAVSSALSN
jgi:hypothetical protein